MSAPVVDETFLHTWSAQLLPTPPLIMPARHFIFPQAIAGEEDTLARGALLVSVMPAARNNFLATCALGFQDPQLPSGVWACPDPDDLLAVAGGYAYLIDSRQPEKAQLLEQRPVTVVLPAPEQDLLLLGGFYNVLALGKAGVRWRSQRLSWEGINLHSIQGGTLKGTGWDMFSDTEKTFILDLETGQHEGGGYASTSASSAR